MSEQVISSEQATTALTLKASWKPSQATLELNQEITTSTKLAELRAEGKTLTLQELDKLDIRVIALEKIARIKDRLRRLESRKRSSDTLDKPRD
jgi:hypothetical protein